MQKIKLYPKAVWRQRQAAASLQLEQREKPPQPNTFDPTALGGNEVVAGRSPAAIPAACRAPWSHAGPVVALLKFGGQGERWAPPEKKGGKGTRQQPPTGLMRGWISSIIG